MRVKPDIHMASSPLPMQDIDIQIYQWGNVHFACKMDIGPTDRMNMDIDRILENELNTWQIYHFSSNINIHLIANLFGMRVDY